MQIDTSRAQGFALALGLLWCSGVAAAQATGMDAPAGPVGTTPTTATPLALPAQLQDFDAYVEGVRKQFDVPGIAVAIVKDGKVVLERGYGVRELGKPAPVEAGTLAQAREDFERRYILRHYHECGGNMSRTAEALGVERSNLYRKMKGYGLLPARRDALEADEA